MEGLPDHTVYKRALNLIEELDLYPAVTDLVGAFIYEHLDDDLGPVEQEWAILLEKDTPDHQARQLTYLKAAVGSSGVTVFHYYDLASLSYNSFEREHALSWAKRGLMHSENFAALHDLISHLYENEGDLDQAYHHSRQACVLDAHNKVYRRRFDGVQLRKKIVQAFSSGNLSQGKAALAVFLLILIVMVSGSPHSKF